MNRPRYLEYGYGKRPVRHRVTRAHRRVMVALLSGASNLSGYPLSRVAQVGAGKVYLVLADLENVGWVAGDWERRDDDRPRRRFYSLTPFGRERVMDFLGLKAEAS